MWNGYENKSSKINAKMCYIVFNKTLTHSLVTGNVAQILDLNFDALIRPISGHRKDLGSGVHVGPN